ncbi:hypothetical protein V8J36_05265 [Frigidibacter sp. MR17.14]|uniref:hypothetical protein n=1 Tax=Frigidibacter sp. MR17.14 TaxID=3126509 RepID=UPI003012B1C7
MSQHDYNIENQYGAAFRADINAALLAIATMNSGAAPPETTYPHQLWRDTTTDTVKMRRPANDGWITIGTVDGDVLRAPAIASTALDDFLSAAGFMLTDPAKVPTRAAVAAGRIPDFIATGVGLPGTWAHNDVIPFDTIVRNVMGASLSGGQVVIPAAGQYLVKARAFARITAIPTTTQTLGLGLYNGNPAANLGCQVGIRVASSAANDGGRYLPLEALMTCIADDRIRIVGRGGSYVSNAALLPDAGSGAVQANFLDIWRIS